MTWILWQRHQLGKSFVTLVDDFYHQREHLKRDGDRPQL